MTSKFPRNVARSTVLTVASPVMTPVSMIAAKADVRHSPPMSTPYVLVDFEHVQPDLSQLAHTPYKLKIFFGARQQEGRGPLKLLLATKALGDAWEPVLVSRSGRNAVDMHIAYWIGR